MAAQQPTTSNPMLVKTDTSRASRSCIMNGPNDARVGCCALRRR